MVNCLVPTISCSETDTDMDMERPGHPQHTCMHKYRCRTLKTTTEQPAAVTIAADDWIQMSRCPHPAGVSRPEQLSSI